MKSTLVAILLSLATLCGVAGQVSAAPLVSAGSSYSVYIAGSDSGAPFLATGIFDGAATAFTRSGLRLSLTESETVTGLGKSLIRIDLSANGDLFPSIYDEANIGVGIDGNGLDFATPVFLTDARIILYAGSALIFRTDNLADLIIARNPWDGIFPVQDFAFAIGGAGALGISHFALEFQLRDKSVPEPGSLVLGGIALAALAGVRRFRRKPQVRSAPPAAA
jgi:hypothetical protein